MVLGRGRGCGGSSGINQDLGGVLHTTLAPPPRQLAVFLTQPVVAESLCLAGLGLLCVKIFPGEYQE